jgi:AraC-like DNA-binding protein
MELVEQSDGRIRRVEDFAQMLNVTPKYLSKLLMKTMNRKPSEMVTLFTLKAIENRLRYSDMTMQQIADELNFSSASSFGKFVKEHLGTTPLDFRKRYHENK